MLFILALFALLLPFVIGVNFLRLLCLEDARSPDCPECKSLSFDCYYFSSKFIYFL